MRLGQNYSLTFRIVSIDTTYVGQNIILAGGATLTLRDVSSLVCLH
jgi:hypothetical protein